VLDDRDELYLTKLAMLETEVRQNTQLLRTILAAVSAEKCVDVELPDGLSLPLSSMSELWTAEESLNDSSDAVRKLVVIANCYCHSLWYSG